MIYNEWHRAWAIVDTEMSVPPMLSVIIKATRRLSKVHLSIPELSPLPYTGSSSQSCIWGMV